jgi:hypothetical protein
MADALKAKVANLVSSWDRRYGKVERPPVVPPPTAADAGALAAVAAKNAQIVAGVVLGLHGPSAEGFEAARKLMSHFVDWNEVRVSRPVTLIAALGRQSRAAERIALLQRFLEAYFLRQRSLNLDYLFTLKSHEVRRFLSDLEVFDREELAAVFLVGFAVPVFPPAEILRETAIHVGVLRPKTTALQMAKKFETSLDEPLLFSLYSHLYSVANDPDAMKKKKK